MNNGNQKASLKISEYVVETIAQVSALEIDGVADTAYPKGSYQGVFKNYWTKNPIEIQVYDGIAEISICLMLEYGANISEVCEAVQKNIKENVQTMTGIIVSKVNIAVEDISLPKVQKPKEDEQNPEEEITQ